MSAYENPNENAPSVIEDGCLSPDTRDSSYGRDKRASPSISPSSLPSIITHHRGDLSFRAVPAQ